MSCYVIFYKDGAKMMRPVLTAAEYREIRDTARNRAADKKHMVQMNYSCLPNEDGTLKGSTQMSATVGMDVDHIPTGEIEAVRERILAKREELGLLMLELSASGAGYHLAFRRRRELSQEENLRWASDVLGVKYDEGAKDITRVFFTPPTDRLIWLDEELFEKFEGFEKFEKFEKFEGFESTCSQTSQTSQTLQTSQTSQTLQTPQPSQTPQTSQTLQTPQTPQPPQPLELSYDGIPYPFVVEALENQLGGVPAHGSRNQFIFAMACHLRYVCNDDAEWIARVLPTYGEAREKWMATIRSACSRSQNKTVPKLLTRALEQARLSAPLAQREGTGEGSGSESAPPAMPRKLPPLIKLLVSKTPRIYQPAVAHAVFPALAAHLWHTRFKYIDNVEHEATLMNVLMAGTGAGKNCIAAPIDCILKDIRQRDALSLEKERQWKEEMNSKGANKDKRKRPEGIVVQEVDADMTNAAFVLRLAEAEERFLYVRMNEIDQFDALKTSARSKSQFQIMCLAFDPGNTYGQTRVGTQSVSQRVTIRFNWNASTTIRKGQQYFRQVLTDGPVSRINFCTIPEQPIGAEMPVYGQYDAEFESQLRPYIDRLNAARGLIECPQATRLAKRLKEENADFARLSQSRVYENLSFRANVIAFLKAMVLYVAHGEQWDRTMEDFIRWSEQYDLWCKMHFFGEMIERSERDDEPQRKPGPRNMLDLLPERFTMEEVVNVRRLQGLPASQSAHMLANWKGRKYIDEVEPGVWQKVRA